MVEVSCTYTNNNCLIFQETVNSKILPRRILNYFSETKWNDELVVCLMGNESAYLDLLGKGSNIDKYLPVFQDHFLKSDIDYKEKKQFNSDDPFSYLG